MPAIYFQKKGEKAQFNEHQCKKCGRMTYIHHGDESDLDFGEFRCTFCKCLTTPTREYTIILDKTVMV